MNKFVNYYLQSSLGLFDLHVIILDPLIRAVRVKQIYNELRTTQVSKSAFCYLFTTLANLDECFLLL